MAKQNKRPTEDEMTKRILLSRLLLARGFSWPLIQRELSLSLDQMSLIRARVQEENKEFIDKHDIADAFVEYKDVVLQAMNESQFIIDIADTPGLKLKAIQQKVDLAERIIKIGLEAGIWQKQKETVDKFTMEATKRLQASGKDLAQRVMQRVIETSEPTRALEPGFEE